MQAGRAAAAIRKSGIYFGEVFDARIVPQLSAGVRVLDHDLSVLVPHETTPVRELSPLDPVKTWTDAEGGPCSTSGRTSAATLPMP